MKRLEYKYIVALVAVLGLFMELLDMTIINVAVPTLAKDFKAGPTTIEWVVTGYLLSLAVFIPVSGWAGDRFGTKRTFTFALGMFTFSSILCAFAWNVESLIAFRALQGVGGGMLTPVGFSMVYRAFPPHERARASSLMVIPTTVAPASGPVVGGLLIDTLSWQWIFLVNIPVGILGLVIATKYLKEHKEPDAGKLDVPGFVLAAAGLGSILYALAEAGTRGFDDTRVLLFGAAGIALMVSFVFVELRSRLPMIDVRLFRDNLFRSCNLAQFAGQTGFAGSLFLLPIMLQSERGLSPLDSGLATFPMAIGVMSMAPFVGRLYPKVGPRRLVAAGLFISTITTLAFLLMDLETNLWWIRLTMYIRGLGFGMMLVPLQAATFGTIKPQDTGRASAIYTTGRQVAQSFGIAIVATVLATRLVDHGAGGLGPAGDSHAALMAFHDAFFAASVLGFIGIIVALVFISDREAAPTMRARGAAAPPAEGAVGEPVAAAH
ncbi:hypothetical protein AYO38_07280 [bacterium SCGC AG-212-C10]|nr:hypothetical protein AYO38_07280 [bacterium SCGC AG-212-C10]